MVQKDQNHLNNQAILYLSSLLLFLIDSPFLQFDAIALKEKSNKRLNIAGKYQTILDIISHSKFYENNSMDPNFPFKANASYKDNVNVIITASKNSGPNISHTTFDFSKLLKQY